jgi:hypothetical protein
MTQSGQRADPFQYCYLSRYDPQNRGSNMPLFNIGFVIFPDLTQLDFTGPLQVLSRLPQSAIGRGLPGTSIIEEAPEHP